MDLVHKESVEAVCGCSSCVNFKEPRYHSIYRDRLVYFCSRSCKVEFEEDPAEFLESDHFKIEFETLDRVEERKRENLSQAEIEKIEKARAELAEDGLLTFIKR